MTESEAEPISWQTRAVWVGLAALPSGLLTAVTTYITTDVASVPFVWVVPLAMFLLTFIIVFRDELPFNYRIVTDGLPFALLFVVLLPAAISVMPVPLSLVALTALAAFFLASLLCHRELYLRRPGAANLTQFYIWMSAGGVLGGSFAALVAPQIFSSIIEFPLLLVLTLLCRPGILLGNNLKLRASRILMPVATIAALFLSYKAAVAHGIIATEGLWLAALILTTLLGIYYTRSWPEHRALLISAMVLCVAIVPSDSRTMYLERSFFGTLRVTQTPDGQHRFMLHGTTIHGAQRLKTETGEPITVPTPATYYYPGSPMTRGVEIARHSTQKSGKPFAAAVIGLGTGSLACSAKDGETWRFFELDPMVARAAQNPKYFTFMPTCLPDSKVVLGDARLTVQKEPNGLYDYLVVDAFSSDAIPVHLLTTESLGDLSR